MTLSATNPLHGEPFPGGHCYPAKDHFKIPSDSTGAVISSQGDLPQSRASAILVTDQAGRIRDLNACARTLLHGGTVLCQHAGILTTADVMQRPRWMSWLRRSNEHPDGSRLLLQRPSDQRLMTILRLDDEHVAIQDAEATRRIVLEVTDPHHCLPDARVRAQAAMALFGWTRRDADVVEQLLNGLSAAEAAKSVGISLGNLRQRLKTIYAKSGVQSQMQLLLLLGDIR